MSKIPTTPVFPIQLDILAKEVEEVLVEKSLLLDKMMNKWMTLDDSDFVLMMELM